MVSPVIFVKRMLVAHGLPLPNSLHFLLYFVVENFKRSVDFNLRDLDVHQLFGLLINDKVILKICTFLPSGVVLLALKRLGAVRWLFVRIGRLSLLLSRRKRLVHLKVVRAHLNL